MWIVFDKFLPTCLEQLEILLLSLVKHFKEITIHHRQLSMFNEIYTSTPHIGHEVKYVIWFSEYFNASFWNHTMILAGASSRLKMYELLICPLNIGWFFRLHDFLASRTNQNFVFSQQKITSLIWESARSYWRARSQKDWPTLLDWNTKSTESGKQRILLHHFKSPILRFLYSFSPINRGGMQSDTDYSVSPVDHQYS